MIRSSIRVGLFVAATAATSACAARVEARPPPATTPAAPSARLEIADGDAQPLALVMPIAERGASRVEAHAGSAFYKVSLARDGADGALRFEIDRSDARGSGERDVRVAVSVRMRRGVRVVLAKLTRPDGPTTTITASLL